jgi:hypothetical protein
MAKYLTVNEFLSSPYGADYQPGDSIFTTSGEIDFFLDSICSIVDVYCGRTFDVQAYQDVVTDEYSGAIMLRNFPVKSVDSIEFESFAPTYYTDMTYVTGVGTSGVIDPLNYFVQLNVGKIKFRYGLNPAIIYKVNYTAGYDTVPGGIKQACLMLANTYAQSIDNGNVGMATGGALTSFRFNKFQEVYADERNKNQNLLTGIPVTVLAILNKYKALR